MNLRDSRILVTGGTGSFGHRVAVHLQKLGPRTIRIFSRDEKKQSDMRRHFPDFEYVLGCVRDRDRVDVAMRRIDFVFHAAALKQVPSCESQPLEALKTNTLGSLNVCEAAIASGVQAVVALTTDKAVKPVNAMGLTKALMERIVCSQNADASVATVFSCVRYGNVLGSRGSVVPLFRELIDQQRALTITVPDMTRFLLTLDESVDLVRHALSSARGGEVFVRKAPACTVLDLAKAMRRRFSRLGDEHPIEVVGPRPGEKIHETLVNEYEMQRARDEGPYFRIEPEYRCFLGETPAPLGSEYTSENTERLTDIEAIANLVGSAGAIESFV